MEQTTFGNKCGILAQLWLEFRDDENFKDFIDYNDLGLPLAFAFDREVINQDSPVAVAMVNETFDLLLGAMGFDEDLGWETLDGLLDDAEGVEP